MTEALILIAILATVIGVTVYLYSENLQDDQQ